ERRQRIARRAEHRGASSRSQGGAARRSARRRRRERAAGAGGPGRHRGCTGGEPDAADRRRSRRPRPAGSDAVRGPVAASRPARRTSSLPAGVRGSDSSRRRTAGSGSGTPGGVGCRDGTGREKGRCRRRPAGGGPASGADPTGSGPGTRTGRRDREGAL
ncbi:MAG: hypothetical protein AVDCRST_MAG29-2208, partial [uncultured Nocardioidaceae bacterium]